DPIDLGYQSIVELAPNQRLVSPQHAFPQNNFDGAVNSYLRQIASALFLTYATLTSDNSGESYGTTRHGSTIERDHWKQVQRWFAKRFHQPIYRAWISNAVLKGRITLDTRGMEALHKVGFVSRGFRWVDPNKDIKAYIEGLKEGIFTRSEVVAELG